MLRKPVSPPPADPLPSSTLILLREDVPGDGFSVLLLERHGSIAFPGAHAFPGGVVDPGDAEASGATLPADQHWAPAGEGDVPPDALRYWITALREVFEEVGLLFATRNGRLIEGTLAPDLQALRARVYAGEPFGAVLESAGLVPATDRIFSFARWITPVTNPRRWDTRFLVARTPAGQEASVDGTETVSCVWYTPRAALGAYEAGKIMLIPPTVRTLDDLARFPSVDAVLEDAARRVVRAKRPELATNGGTTVLRYPDNTGHDDLPERRLVLRDGRWWPSD